MNGQIPDITLEHVLDNPVDSMAELILSFWYIYDLETRVQKLKETVRDWKIDGVILHNNMSCRPNACGMSDLKRRLMEEADIHDYDFDPEMNWLRDQSNFRTISPYYDLTDDVNDDFTKDLEMVTNCFAIKFGFNDTVSTTDGAKAQVNLTIRARDSNEIPAEIIVDGTFIWIIFTEPIVCYDESYNFDIDLSFADLCDIYLGNITTVRVETFDDDDNLGTATVLCEAFLDLYNQHNSQG